MQLVSFISWYTYKQINYTGANNEATSNELINAHYFDESLKTGLVHSLTKLRNRQMGKSNFVTFSYLFLLRLFKYFLKHLLDFPFWYPLIVCSF